MLDRFSGSLITVAIAAAVLGGMTMFVRNTSAQAPSLKTPWGEPDLQGIWTVEYDTPFQRNAKYGTREFFTEAERTEFDRIRMDLHGRDNRGARGTELDVQGAYNNVFGALKRTGPRTSAIIDPPDGRIPALTPEAAKFAASDREFRLAMMQAT